MGRLLLAALLLLAPPAARAAAPVAVITARPAATVPGPVIHLGEVAAIRSAERALAEQLQRLELGPAPEPGKTRTLDVALLRLRVQQSGVDPHTITFAGPAQIAVHREARELSREELAAEVQRLLRQAVPAARGPVAVRGLTLPERLLLPTGRLAIEVQGAGGRLIGQTALAILVRVDGVLAQKLWTPAYIEVTGPVVVAQRSLRAGEIVGEGDVAVIGRDLATLPAGVLTRAEDAVGKRARTGVDANRILTAQLLETPPLVKRGDVVTLLAESARVRVSAQGMVQQTGARGERVRVTNLTSKREVYGRVIDAKTVQVDF